MSKRTGESGVPAQQHFVTDVAVDCRSQLGEGVTWDAHSKTLLWLDIDMRLFHRLHSDGRHEVTELDRTTSVVVPRRGGGFIAVAGCEILPMDSAGNFGASLATLPNDGDGLANDGRCDPHGCLWVGTVDRSGNNSAGLFRVDASGRITKMLSNRALSNGIDWSPDGTRCYHSDSLMKRIDVLKLDDNGNVLEVEEFARFDLMPDGLSVDEEGGVWVAFWDGKSVRRFTPDGRLDVIVEVPGGWITSCAFAGENLQRLYITSARVDLSAEEYQQQPHAGSLFSVDLDIAGRGYTPFGLN